MSIEELRALIPLEHAQSVLAIALRVLERIEQGQNEGKRFSMPRWEAEELVPPLLVMLGVQYPEIFDCPELFVNLVASHFHPEH